jgi:hypothetical protein
VSAFFVDFFIVTVFDDPQGMNAESGEQQSDC